MLQGTPSRRDFDAAAAAFGLDGAAIDGAHTGADVDQGCELWPEHAVPVAIFQRMAGQWRMGPGGPYALDYTALPVVLRALRVGRAAQREAFEPLRAMEAEALRWFGEQQG